jgi:hypothetical protein
MKDGWHRPQSKVNGRKSQGGIAECGMRNAECGMRILQFSISEFGMRIKGPDYFKDRMIFRIRDGPSPIRNPKSVFRN